MAPQNKLAPEVRKATLAEIRRKGLENLRSVTIFEQFAGRVPKSTVFRIIKNVEAEVRLGIRKSQRFPHQGAAERMGEALGELNAAVGKVAREMDNVARIQDAIMSEMIAASPEVRERIINRILSMS